MAKKTIQDGIALFKKGDLDGATKIFLGLIERNQDEASAHLWMGNCHVLDNNLDAARVSFRCVLTCGDEAQRSEALHQLRSISFTSLLQRLLLEPPLRYLLIAALFFYGTSYFLFQFPQLQRFAIVGQLISVGVLLPLFFVWALFIITYFVTNMAFHPTKRGIGVQIARIFVGLGLLSLFPVGFLAFTQRTYLWIGLSAFFGFFAVSLLVSRVLQSIGRGLLGEASPLLMISLFGSPTMQEVPLHLDNTHNR